MSIPTVIDPMGEGLSPLPSGYTLLDSVIFTKYPVVQSIMTGDHPGPDGTNLLVFGNTYRWELDYAPLGVAIKADGAGTPNFAGGAQASGVYVQMSAVHNAARTYAVDIGGNTYTSNIVSMTNVRDPSTFRRATTIIDLLRNTVSVVPHDDPSAAWSTAVTPPSISVHYMSINGRNGYRTAVDPGYQRVWGSRIYINDKLVQNLIPVKDAAGVVCMYDTVMGNTFYPKPVQYFTDNFGPLEGVPLGS